MYAVAGCKVCGGETVSQFEPLHPSKTTQMPSKKRCAMIFGKGKYIFSREGDNLINYSISFYNLITIWTFLIQIHPFCWGHNGSLFRIGCQHFCIWTHFGIMNPWIPLWVKAVRSEVSLRFWYCHHFSNLLHFERGVIHILAPKSYTMFQMVTKTIWYGTWGRGRARVSWDRIIRGW